MGEELCEQVAFVSLQLEVSYSANQLARYSSKAEKKVATFHYIWVNARLLGYYG